MSLSTRVLVGLFSGVATGIFLGELAAPLKVVGDAFIQLLQMTVLPYIVVSLIAGLGSLSYTDARRLANTTALFLLLLWGIGLLAVFLMPLTYPNWETASFFSPSLVQSGSDFNYLQQYIPANLFNSLANNMVPAVVLFSLALGVALIGVGKKATLIEMLNTLAAGLGRITGFVVGLAPYGVFAIVAAAAGTLGVEELTRLQVYLLTMVVAALVLSLWALPAVVASLTPLSVPQVLRSAREVLVTAFATGSVFIVLPLMSEQVKKLLDQISRESDEGHSTVDVVVPTSFSFPSAGKVLGLSFVLFAGWMADTPVAVANYPLLAATGVPSFFGSSTVAVPYLLDLFRVPADTFQFFVVADQLLVSRFDKLVAVMHILALSTLAGAAVAGGLTVRWSRVFRFGAVTVGIAAISVVSLRVFFETIVSFEYRAAETIVGMDISSPLADAVIVDSPAPAPPERLAAPGLERIRERGTLRVGYYPEILPFSFVNRGGRLVGIDIELAHILANDLALGLELVEVAERAEVGRLLDDGTIDIAVSSLPVTPDRFEQVAFTRPYLNQTLAFVVRDHRREDFSSRAAVQQQRGLRLAMPRTSYYADRVQSYLPDAEIVYLDSLSEFFEQDGEEYDALVFSAEAGSAQSLIYPRYTVAIPHPDVVAVPTAFGIRRGDEELLRVVNSWLQLKDADGTIGRLYNYWILGQEAAVRQPRWSVIRNVLGWVE